MTFITKDGSDGYLRCDNPIAAERGTCLAVSERFRYYLGGKVPAGWATVTPVRTPNDRSTRPQGEQHLCPEHSGP
jgi:hypothetical protein